MRKTSRRYRGIIIIHLIHLSAPQIRRLLRLSPSTRDHFRGTCLRLLIEAIKDFTATEYKAACNFWIDNCCVEDEMNAARIVLRYFKTRYEARFSSFFPNRFQKRCKWLACDFHTRRVNVNRRLSNLRVDRYTSFRTTKRSVTRDDTDLSIPARVAN